MGASQAIRNEKEKKMSSQKGQGGIEPDLQQLGQYCVLAGLASIIKRKDAQGEKKHEVTISSTTQRASKQSVFGAKSPIH